MNIYSRSALIRDKVYIACAAVNFVGERIAKPESYGMIFFYFTASAHTVYGRAPICVVGIVNISRIIIYNVTDHNFHPIKNAPTKNDGAKSNLPSIRAVKSSAFNKQHGKQCLLCVYQPSSAKYFIVLTIWLV